jgi:hypothetical protein
VFLCLMYVLVVLRLVVKGPTELAMALRVLWLLGERGGTIAVCVCMYVYMYVCVCV